MNRNIEALCNIAAKAERTIIGLMSGTSFDGLDIAVCVFTGSGLDTRARVTHFHTASYRQEFKEDIKTVFAQQMASLEKVTLLNALIGTYFGELVNEAMSSWGLAAADIDLVASHGQTIFHAPFHQHKMEGYPNATLQIGDGDHLSMTTGIITLSDFRQKHIAAGGEGAPLAVYGDYLIFSSQTETRVMLNIGGIANFTFLPAGNAQGFFSTDVGPGNTLMDQFIQLKKPGTYYDKNAEMASSGNVHQALLDILLDHPFFDAPFPKTTGPELFNMAYLQGALNRLSDKKIADEDVMATLAAFSAEGIIRAINTAVGTDRSFTIYISGGGMYNPLVKNHIENYFHRTILSTEALGIHPDAKEAVLFALLANEAVAGGHVSFGKDRGMPGVSMGKVSFPN